MHWCKEGWIWPAHQEEGVEAVRTEGWGVAYYFHLEKKLSLGRMLKDKLDFRHQRRGKEGHSSFHACQGPFIPLDSVPCTQRSTDLNIPLPYIREIKGESHQEVCPLLPQQFPSPQLSEACPALLPTYLCVLSELLTFIINLLSNGRKTQNSNHKQGLWSKTDEQCLLSRTNALS